MNRLVDGLAFFVDNIFLRIRSHASRFRKSKYPNIDHSVRLGPDVKLIGPIDAFYIGEGSYINDAIINAGSNSVISIGEYCAIGYRVSIKAVTHDVLNPSPKADGTVATTEGSITIGDHCWIGDNVFIKDGVTLGNNVTVGANSVVTKSFTHDVVIAGVPAKVIRNTVNDAARPK